MVLHGIIPIVYTGVWIGFIESSPSINNTNKTLVLFLIIISYIAGIASIYLCLVHKWRIGLLAAATPFILSLIGGSIPNTQEIGSLAMIMRSLSLVAFILIVTNIPYIKKAVDAGKHPLKLKLNFKTLLYYIPPTLALLLFLFVFLAGLLNTIDNYADQIIGQFATFCGIIGAIGAWLSIKKRWYGALVAILPIIIYAIGYFSITGEPKSWWSVFIFLSIPPILLASVIPFMKKKLD